MTAKPCVVIPRETCTPIEAILRSPHPHAGVVDALPVARARAHALLGKRLDDRVFHRAQVRVHVVDAHDRIADELPGPVVGDAPAAVAVDHLDACAR